MRSLQSKQTEKLDLRVSEEFKGALRSEAEKRGTSVKAIVVLAVMGEGQYALEVRRGLRAEFNRLTKEAQK
jgi:uncharacterized protein (DUF1778 family)